MTEEITHQVDSPELLEADDDVSISRWTKYGKDRLYINGARVEPYIDLETGDVKDTGMVRVKAERDGDIITIEIGQPDDHSPHQIIVISLSGRVPAEYSDDTQTESNQQAAEPTVEHAEEVGYNTAAGQAQQIEAQRLLNGDDSDA